jgi:hypothetical protein
MRDVTQESDESTKKQLSNGHRVSCGRVDDRDPQLGCDIERYVVDADTSTPDYA